MVTHKISTAYHPQTNGQTKVTNKAIKRILERSVRYNPKDWSKKLNDALWAFRIAYKTPTGCTPFRMVYGKVCHLPIEIEHKAYWALKQCNMDLTVVAKNRFIELNELMKLRDGAYENTRIYKERTKKWHDSRLRGMQYGVSLGLGYGVLTTCTDLAVKKSTICKEDTAYQRLDFTRKRAYSIPNTAYPTAYIRKGIPKKALAVLTIRQGHIQKPKPQARGKGKNKGKSKIAYDPKHKIPSPMKKEHPAKDGECHHCHKLGNCKRNCLYYLVELKKNKASTSGTSSIFTIELYSIPKTNSCTHICNIIQGLRGIWKLNKGALDLYVGNGNRAVVEAIWSFDLILPSGMIDMHNHVSNEHSIYTCSNKKSKRNLDYTFLWHCRLGLINKKRITKLKHDELLMSIDDESFDVCIYCISGKMAINPFTHAGERTNELLGLIHSNICGLFRTTSRECANYYVSFTNNFSRYGYVYLIKHKHEVFEMFKTFQNEVENQLGKTIKALQSDQGGEYLSQEFLDHLKSRGIISQLTPPYMPQHNGVSERRN
ncbi:retrotransposon protein, putative, ty1-copia subclass [Tanacetum coccineum]